MQSERLTWVISALLCGSLQGQSTFVVHFDSLQSGKEGFAYGIERTRDGYLVSGLQEVSDSVADHHTYLRTLGANGSLISERELWPGVATNLFQVHHDPVCALNDSTYAGHLVWVDPGNELIRKVQFVLFNDEGDTLSTKVVMETTAADSTEVEILQTRQMSNDGFVMAGSRTNLDENPQGLVIRLSETGDSLWTSAIGPPSNSTAVYSVAAYPGQEIVVSGNSSAWGPNSSFLLRLDSSGSVLWREQFGEEAIGKCAVRIGASGDIYTWSPFCDFGWMPLFYAVTDLRKWDSSGNLLWSKRGLTRTRLETTDFEILPDGSFICVAFTGFVSSLMKFSTGGDSLWQRQYWVFSGPGGGTTFPNDVIPTDDGGFAFCGWSEQGTGDPTPGLRTMFVIKTDSTGCVVPGCQYTGIETQIIGLESAVTAHPNPSSGSFNLILDLPEQVPITGNLLLQVFDMQGRLVHARNLGHDRYQRVNVDLTPAPAGLYSAHLSDGKQILTGVRLVVE